MEIEDIEFTRVYVDRMFGYHLSLIIELKETPYSPGPDTDAVPDKKLSDDYHHDLQWSYGIYTDGKHANSQIGPVYFRR